MPKQLFRPAFCNIWYGAPRLIMLDFDGTLSLLAPTPELARFDPETRKWLRRLRDDSMTTVAIVSGRHLADLQKKVNLAGVILVGNHGLTCSQPGLGFDHLRLDVWQERAGFLAGQMQKWVSRFAGARIELKGAEISVHYRNLDPAAVPKLRRRLQLDLPKHSFVWHEGKKVWEFRPPLRRDKGFAVRQLARHLAKGWRQSGCCIFIGDDRTDEDAFAAIRKLGPRAWGFKVGAGKTKAHFRLRNIAMVARFLRQLALPVERTGKK